MIKAVILDNDGVIVQTEVGRLKHLRKLLRKHNLALPNSLLNKQIGKQTKDFLKEVFAQKLSDSEIKAIAKQRMEEFYLNINRYAKPAKGLRKLCKELRNHGYELAVASNSPQHYVERILNHVGIRKYFKAVVSLNGVKHPKPHPEIYIKAAKKLKAKKDQCLVVEDSTIGITSAKKAGLKVAALRNRLYHKRGYRVNYSEADYVINSLQQLPKLIKYINAHQHNS